jgi:hypothetical protein
MMGDWTFFSNYGHVLVCLAKNNEARLRDVAADVGITERAAQKIVKDMQDAGFLTVTKHGRCNLYQINKRKSLRHGLESHCNIGKVLALITKPDPITRPKKARVQAAAADSLPKPAPAAVPEEVKTRYPSVADEAPTLVEENKKADEDSKANVADTREQGSLF